MSHPITTDDIETAIDGRDAPISVTDVDDLLLAVQEEIEDFWNDHMSAIESGSLELVAETDDELVLADHSGDFWKDQFDTLVEYTDLIGAEQNKVPETILAAHHNAAYRLVDYNWATANPVVVRKPADFEPAQRFVEATVNSLISRELSPGQAWAYYGVILRGNSRNQWAQRCGYSDHSVVSGAVRKAENKLTG